MATLNDFIVQLLNPGGRNSKRMYMTGQTPPANRLVQPAGDAMAASPQVAPVQASAGFQTAPQVSGGGFLSRLQGMFGGGSAGSDQNQTVQWLINQGEDPGRAQLIASDPRTLQSYLLDKTQAPKASAFDERARAAQQYGLDPNSDEGRAFILSGNIPEARGGAAELGLNPQYGVDDKGNPVLIQIGKDGKAVKTALPEGVTLSKEPIKVDLGTSWGLIDPITRQMIGTTPKDLAGAAAQTEIGKSQGQAQFDLPRAELNAKQTIETIRKLRDHKGRAGSTGFIQGNFPAYSGDTQDFQNELKKAKGRAFLEAYAMLKGGGQITEVEGAKAEQAIVNLERSTSDEEFVASLDMLEQAIRDGLEKMRRQAGVSNGPAPELPAPLSEPSPDRFGYDPNTGKGGRVTAPNVIDYSDWLKGN